MTRLVNRENNCLKTLFYFSQMPSQPVWTRRPLLSDMELVLLRLFRNRVLRSDLSQLWAAHLTFIPSPGFTPAIAPLCTSLNILGLLSCVIWFSTHTCLAHGFLHFTRLGGKARTCPASTWRDLAVVASILAFRFLRIGISVNSFRLAAFRLTRHVAVFPHRCHFLTSSQHPPWYL